MSALSAVASGSRDTVCCHDLASEEEAHAWHAEGSLATAPSRCSEGTEAPEATPSAQAAGATRVRVLLARLSPAHAMPPL